MTQPLQPRALIIGISGQDGCLLAKFLLNKGYEVYGTSRNLNALNSVNLVRLGIFNQVKLLECSISNPYEINGIINNIFPDEIYNLSGQSSVNASFANPEETNQSITLATRHLLEAALAFEKPIKLFNACSSECFGNTDIPASEDSPFNPVSPYGIAKASAFNDIANYRANHKLFCVSGILFNHESPLRPEHFVVQKIIRAARRIANGSDEKLELGNISVIRDWGWAPDYVEGMWLMMQQPEPKDFVLATGSSCSLEFLLEETFSLLNINWQNHIVLNPAFNRPKEIMKSCADPRRAEKELGWKTNVTLSEILHRMLDDKI